MGVVDGDVLQHAWTRPNQNQVPSSGSHEPLPGDVASKEECRLWAELDEVAFFHYISPLEECHLYRTTMDAVCHSVGGPKAAPSFDQCTVDCPEGWTLASGSTCYFLSTEIASPFSEAVKFCENLGSTLVEVIHVFFLNLAVLKSLFNEDNP